MIKVIFSFIICSFFISAGFSQTIVFTLAAPQPSLVEVYGGSFASGDIDGDGDQDLLITGLDPGRQTALYLNDGNGNFTEVLSTPFPEASNTVTIFRDLDADGDLDLFCSGMGFNIAEFTHIYLNNGSGVFTKRANPALPEFKDSGAIIEDVDNDGDPDILISTADKNNNFVADVYLNDGNANFTAKGSTFFTPVKVGAMAFIDVEKDGDADVILSGKMVNNISSTLLYRNDGLGNYALDTTSVFGQFTADDIDIADTDNDGDLDILISGVKAPFIPSTILYLNDGSGTFTPLAAANLQQTFGGANAFADFDNDGDKDLIVMGSQAGGIPNIFTIIYQNSGNNVFSPVDTIGGEYIADCVIVDFNGDSLLDIITQGFVENTNVFWNNSIPLSTDPLNDPLVATTFPNPSNGKFYVQSNAEQPLSISIYSVNGKLIYQHDSISGMHSVDLTLPDGLYFALLQSENRTQTLKLTISN